MDNRQFGAAGSLAVLAMLAASACATGGGGSADGPSDAASDRGAGGDAPWVAQDGGSDPDASAWFYDSSGASSDGSGGDSATGSADSSLAGDTGGDASGGGAGDADASGGDAGGTDSSGGDAADTGIVSTGLSVQYAVQDSAAMSAYIGCELSVVNSGSMAVAVSSLEARYYYLAGGFAPQMTINWSHVSTSGANTDLGVTYSVVAMQSPAPSADTYIAFDLSSSHSMLAPGESAVFSWQLQGPNPAADIYDQSSDYSFNGAMTALTSWPHVPLFESGSVVWGAPP
jgi:hypothetical protein